MTRSDGGMICETPNTHFKMVRIAIYVSTYLGPVLTWSCNQIAHKGQFGCFHIVYNWPTSSDPKVLNSETWDVLMAKLNNWRGRV